MILTIQCYYRNYCEMQSCRQSYLAQCRAILVIQSAVRAYLSCRQFKERHNAVLLLQSRVRSMQARELYKRKMQAIILIQRSWRNYLIRCESLQQCENDAAITIQAAVRHVQAKVRNCISY